MRKEVNKMLHVINFRHEARNISQITSGSHMRRSSCMGSGNAGDFGCSIQWMPAGFRNMIV